MIEDKKHGIKVSENPTESKWLQVSEQNKRVVKQLKEEIKAEQKNIKMSDREIGKKIRDGERKTIKEMKLQIKIYQEIQKLADSKILKGGKK